ncbi:phytanoyl-CoA dioxygenase [Rhexocercosporidium sp. MPI-PUGE-AT-0058]|nr:phytanoyl-CoA dioxygenase [Rhexocercosporidium sp. MPI-PUGE-AT-0058]
MAPSATSTSTSPEISSPPIPNDIAQKLSYNDWREDLRLNGYAVVKNAIPLDRALAYQQKAFDWLKSFGTDLDLNDHRTWVKENLPVQTKINTFASYCVAHERFMWEARMEPGVLDAFATIWGTHELLASFDSLNVTFPNRTDVPRKPPWEHTDQSPLRRGLQCVQGIINLSTSGPEDGGLVVYPKSHLYRDEFYDSQTEETKSSWTALDRYMFDAKQLEWFAGKGIHPKKVCAEVGDLILWDSRTIHYGSEPSPLSSTIRTVIYAAYTPAKLASADALRTKAEIFKEFGGTTHWPHDNIVRRDCRTFLDDGERDPRDRNQPLELPEMSSALLKLAGVENY